MGNIAKGVGVIGNRNFIGRTKWAQAKYDFAVDGGVVGDIIPVQSDTIPSGAVIVDALLLVDTIVTGGASCTLAVKVEGAADIASAAVVTGAPWSTATKKRATFTATTAPVVTTADRQITMTVGTTAVTAGVVRVIVAYVEVAA